MTTGQAYSSPDSPKAPPGILKAYLDPIVDKYERSEFINRDPISVPHGFEDPADKELIGLFCALLAWGRRETLLLKLVELCERMDYQPKTFVYNFNYNRDSAALEGFKHRTFNSQDAIHLCLALKAVLRDFGSIEKLASSYLNHSSPHAGPCIEGLSSRLLSGPPLLPERMRKHLARPSCGSACKRICLFFRWMVRPGPVDLGIWSSIGTHQLLLPLDVHSGRQARAIGLLSRKSDDWRAVLELTEACKTLNPYDPTRYDFALFGSGEAGETLDLSSVTQ